MNGAPGRCGEGYTVSESDINMMRRANDPRKRAAAIAPIDREAARTAENNAALIDGVDKVYLHAGGTEPRTATTASVTGTTLQ